MNEFKNIFRSPGLWVSLAVTLLPMIAGMILWNRLPVEIATHFNANGEADGWSSRAFTVFGLPAILFVIEVLCLWASSKDPKGENIPRVMVLFCLWVVPVISLIACSLVYLYALGIPIRIVLVMKVIIGVLFVLIGNFLPKVGQNFTVGVKTPWSLTNRKNWNKTNRFSGRLWVAGGILALLSVLIPDIPWWIYFLFILVMAGAPILYSYLEYRRERQTL